MRSTFWWITYHSITGWTERLAPLPNKQLEEVVVANQLVEIENYGDAVDGVMLIDAVNLLLDGELEAVQEDAPMEVAGQAPQNQGGAAIRVRAEGRVSRIIVTSLYILTTNTF